MARWVKSKQQMNVFKTAAAPTVLGGLKVGDLWIDITSGAVVKVCTDTAGPTFDTLSTGGGGGSVTGPVSSTDNAVARFDGAGGATLQNSGVIVSDANAITGVASLAFSSTSGIIGTTTNDNAAAGSVGEIVTSTVDFGTEVSLTTATETNVTSISLTAGDWDISGNICFKLANTASLTAGIGWASLTSATLPDASIRAKPVLSSAYVASGTQAHSFPIPPLRISTASTVTVYLSCYAEFSVAAVGGCGIIIARRRR